MVENKPATAKISAPGRTAAVDRIDKFHAEGRIKVVTSRETTREQLRTVDPIVRSALAEHADDISMVQGDHRVLGFSNLDYGALGFISYPLVTDIVNEDPVLMLGSQPCMKLRRIRAPE